MFLFFFFLTIYEEGEEEKKNPSVNECCSHGCDNDVCLFLGRRQLADLIGVTFPFYLQASAESS